LERVGASHAKTGQSAHGLKPHPTRPG
jgi:hypothetical protein